ncbi:hypothetical protein [Kangiella sp. HZ709]|uniref:flagellar basal body rod protein FlgB n=1 Tax=Kangiella sp. HZ709 TaxID=2666328 RepID=UPI0012B09189|nr:hypothetical protein [Kangiella sp. HZ709]MRX26853.1 hypothetical protein [Kangiella sp. HZ709]
MEISDVTTKLATWSLSRILEQQSYISQNIANANVNGYKAVRADFSDALNKLQSIQQNHNLLSQQLQSGELSPAMTYRAEGLLNDAVQLDKEVAELVKNSKQYNGIVELLNRNFGLMKMAVSNRR